MWAAGEALLRRVLQRVGDFYEAKGEAAFYGPKIDVQFNTVAGKDETLLNVQVDFHLPAQFELEYVTEDGGGPADHCAPWGAVNHGAHGGIAHRGVRGAFPLWLAPTQAIVIPIADRHVPYAQEVYSIKKAPPAC